MKEGFNIIIKDNFLEEELFQKLHSKINYLPYQATYDLLYDPSNLSKPKHPWFSHPVEEYIKEIIKNKCEEMWGKKFKAGLCSYTMLASVEPLPHCDLTEKTDHQIIIYIKGNINLNKGTGFYLNNTLNTHVGFNENRAISWESNAIHTPLNWASDDKSKRFSIICQLKEIN